MSSDSRVVYGRRFRVTPVRMWVLQRISGVLLGPLVAAHIFVPEIGRHPILSSILLLVIVSHGYVGIRRLIARVPLSTASLAAAGLWTLAVLAFGVIAIVNAG